MRTHLAQQWMPTANQTYFKCSVLWEPNDPSYVKYCEIANKERTKKTTGQVSSKKILPTGSPSNNSPTIRHRIPVLSSFLVPQMRPKLVFCGLHSVIGVTWFSRTKLVKNNVLLILGAKKKTERFVGSREARNVGAMNSGNGHLVAWSEWRIENLLKSTWKRGTWDLWGMLGCKLTQPNLHRSMSKETFCITRTYFPMSCVPIVYVLYSQPHYIPIIVSTLYCIPTVPMEPG